MLRIFGLACAALLLVAGVASAEPRVALVIGNSNYGGDLGVLPNPVNDAALMANTLKGIGFEVIESEDADQNAMRRAIQEFGARLAQSGGGATGLFFYAGHGLQVGGTNYLIPIHANIAREGDADIEAVPVDLVMKQMAFADSAVNIVILDACRNNPLSRGFRDSTRGLADPTIRPMGSFIAYSTAPGDVAEDGKGANSAYSLALAGAIVKPGASINDVFQEVRGKVLTATNRKQVPWDASSLTAPFYFVAAAVTPPAPAPVPADTVSLELVLWNEVKDSKSAEDYQAYLEKFPNGTFAPLARIRAKQAGETASRDLPQAAPAPADAGQSGVGAAVEDAFWGAVSAGDSAEEYQAYLKRYPNGAYAAEARQRMAALTSAPPPEPETAVAAAAAATPKPRPEIVALQAKLYARDKARLRDTPSAEGAVVARLTANMPLDATGRTEDGAWWRVTLSDGRAGFIAASVVTDQPPPPPALAPTTQPALPPPSPPPSPPSTAAAAGPDADVCSYKVKSDYDRIAAACRRLLDAGIADETDRYNALVHLGQALIDLGKGDEALPSLRQAIDLDPNFYGAYYLIGLVQIDQGKFADARSTLDKAVRFGPDQPDTLFQRGVARGNLGDTDLAIEDIRAAIALKDDMWAYYNQLADLQMIKGNIKAATNTVDKASAVSPTFWGGSSILTYYLAGKFDDAVEMINRGIADQPGFAYLYLWKALALKASGSSGDATTALLDAGVRMNGSKWPAPLLNFVAGKIDEAELRRLAASGSQRTQAEQLSEVDFYTGELAYLAGNREKARRAMQNAANARIYTFVEYAGAKVRLAQMGQ